MDIKVIEEKKVFPWKNVLLYLAKVAVLFLILYFTVIEPFLIGILWIFPYIYIPVYIAIAVFFAEFPQRKNPAGNFFKRHILPVLLLFVGVAVCFLLYFAGEKISEKLLTVHINRFADRAEEIIPYNTNSYYMSGMLGTDFMHNVIMIDYDSKRIAFLFGNIDDYKEFKLESGAVKDTSLLQFTAELNAPGDTLTTYYYKDKTYAHMTTAIMLKMADGTVWSVSGLENSHSGKYDSSDSFLALRPDTITLDERETVYLVSERHKADIFGGDE